jgi:hypothetical protein
LGQIVDLRAKYKQVTKEKVALQEASILTSTSALTLMYYSLDLRAVDGISGRVTNGGCLNRFC